MTKRATRPDAKRATRPDVKRATYGQGSVIQRGPRKYTIRWSEGRDPFTGKHIRHTLTLHAAPEQAVIAVGRAE